MWPVHSCGQQSTGGQTIPFPSGIQMPRVLPVTPGRNGLFLRSASAACLCVCVCAWCAEKCAPPERWQSISYSPFAPAKPYQRAPSGWGRTAQQLRRRWHIDSLGRLLWAAPRGKVARMFVQQTGWAKLKGRAKNAVQK